jgi:hypothetical protein
VSEHWVPIVKAFEKPSDEYGARTVKHYVIGTTGQSVDPNGPMIPERPLPESDFVVLWRAVVLQMFKDAMNNWSTMVKDSNRARYYHNYLQARRWLDGAWPEDFLDVCERARLDPDAVRSRWHDIRDGRVAFNPDIDPIDDAKAATEDPS